MNPWHQIFQVMVFTAISRDGFVFWRIFKSDVKINADIYRRRILIPMVQKLTDEGRLADSIFMQDGAPCHTAVSSRNYLKSKFGDRIISNKEPVEWAPSSPDLNVGFAWPLNRLIHPHQSIFELKKNLVVIWSKYNNFCIFSILLFENECRIGSPWSNAIYILLSHFCEYPGPD